MSTEDWAAALTAAGERLAAGRAGQQEALDEARRLAVEAVGAGIAQTVVAAALGISRMTLHDWLKVRD